MINYKEPMFLIFLLLAISLLMQIIDFLISIFQYLRRKYDAPGDKKNQQY
jgi:hypothetical protein